MDKIFLIYYQFNRSGTSPALYNTAKSLRISIFEVQKALNNIVNYIERTEKLCDVNYIGGGGILLSKFNEPLCNKFFSRGGFSGPARVRGRSRIEDIEEKMISNEFKRNSSSNPSDNIKNDYDTINIHKKEESDNKTWWDREYKKFIITAIITILITTFFFLLNKTYN